MSYSRVDYYVECLADSFAEHGVEATIEQIRAVAADVELGAENIGMAFHSPPASDRYNEIEREWKAKYQALQKEFDAYRDDAETAVKRALRQHSDANVSIGQHGEVIRHDGRTTVIQ